MVRVVGELLMHYLTLSIPSSAPVRPHSVPDNGTKITAQCAGGPRKACAIHTNPHKAPPTPTRHTWRSGNIKTIKAWRWREGKRATTPTTRLERAGRQKELQNKKHYATKPNADQAATP